jgi:CRP-like cAMP-binding protein
LEWHLLSGLSPVDVRELLQIARRRRFARNEVVFHRDDPGDSLHLIVEGRFSVRVMTPLGQVATVAIRGRGEAFGEMALVGADSRRTATVTALEASETFAVYREQFDALRARRPEIDELLFRFLVAEVRSLNNRLLEALYLPVEKRVLRRLSELADIYAMGEESLITLTQESVAELAGATRATVNQILREEARHGLLELRRGAIRIIDLDALRKRAR